MRVVYTDHARLRMRQRAITAMEVEHVLRHPVRVQKTFGELWSAVGFVKNRRIDIIFAKRERYIRIVTLI